MPSICNRKSVGSSPTAGFSGVKMLKVNNLEDFWESLLKYCVDRKCDREQVSQGSMPKQTLIRLSQKISGNGLQIGGFVGVTHCFLAKALADTGSICTIDLNIQHRGIHNPLLIASDMAKKFELTNNSTLVCGNALEQMNFFKKLGVQFDFILLDGNHDYENIIKEVTVADEILKDNGYLILDDIDHWDGPKKLYFNFHLNYEVIPLDSRAGLLRKKGSTSPTNV